MNTNESVKGIQGQRTDNLLLFLVFPGVTMSLGWGLRGYIGGGTYGAMIPGALVTMAICLIMRSDPSWAAVAAVFGTVGVAFGGQMTYGQTIGHIVLPESFLWGFTGLALKGCVWGLLGGAMVGLGFSHRQHQRKDIVIAFALLLVASYVGWRLINEPKLIYFSNLEDRPRGESWAGLLFGAFALAGYLEARAGQASRHLPLRFMLWGGLAGLVGFGGGGLFMALSRQVPEALRWLPYWKFMEYSFGLCFGMGLGYCAYLNRSTLSLFDSTDQDDSESEQLSKPAVQLIISIVACFVVFYLWQSVSRGIIGFLQGISDTQVVTEIMRAAWRMLFGYTTMGLVLALMCLVWRRFCWHIVVTVTLYAATWDFTRDLIPDRGFDVSATLQHLMIVFATLIVAGMVVYFEIHRKQPVKPLFLVLTWSCMAIAYLRVLILEMKIFWLDSVAIADSGGFLPYMFSTFKSAFVVHGIFTLEAIAITWMVCRLVSSSKQ